MDGIRVWRRYENVRPGECFVTGDGLRYRKRDTDTYHPTCWELLEVDPEPPMTMPGDIAVQVIDEE